MSKFFTDFPKIQYDLNKNEDANLTVNVLRRFAPLRQVMERAVIYFRYEIHDGERPDIVAHKVYGDSDYFWVLLMFNEIHDPHFEWYKSYYDFISYIEHKYGSIRHAEQTIHHYEWIIQHAKTFEDGSRIPEKILIVDQTTYVGLIDEDRRAVTIMDYEENLNNSRRQIKVLDGQYLPQLDAERARIFVD